METINIDFTPEQYANPELMKRAVAGQMGVAVGELLHVEVKRRSLDSRKRNIRYHAQVEVYRMGEEVVKPSYDGGYQDCSNAPAVVIVGAGPAGLFAALRAIQVGLRPIIVERGQSVDVRKYDLARQVRSQRVNPDSNWSFGEGGAGTYSDGKLFTRSNKRGNIADVINLFIAHGANPTIAIDSHAHIGTDKLSGIIKNIRATIERYGGEYHFGSRVVDLLMREGRVVGVRDANGLTYEGKAVVLATGHSARDIYSLFFSKGWLIEPKPFALGVRVEHPQQLINSIQYHSEHYSPYLPPASYSLTTQANSHGVFSFCMCPGGVIVPAATDYGQQVVNGMSGSARCSAFANSGIAVTVSQADVVGYEQYGPLALMYFQQQVEQVMWRSAGQSLSAPAQRLTDFCNSKMSQSLPRINYMGQVVTAPLHQLLPPFVAQCLQQGFRQFDQKMRGFYTAEASLLAVESRTSSPVRIPRMDDMQHPQLPGLYPCGEGAGYAGGIVSSAMDGINCVNYIVNQ